MGLTLAKLNIVNPIILSDISELKDKLKYLL